MASLFGLPMDKLTNLSDRSEIAPPGEAVIPKSKVVGGNNPDIRVLDFFGYNVTETAHQTLVMSLVAELYTIAPVILILLCQIGFAMLQSGASRVESAAVPFISNLLVLATSCLSYWAVGYALSRSDGFVTLGYHQWFSYEFENELSLDWLLHFSLALTSANIATSGGLERCPLHVYCLISPIITGVLSSLACRWSWHRESWTVMNSPFSGVVFKDQGGAGAIHIIGGSASLALSLILGPRYSRIRSQHTRILYNDLDGHSLPLEMLGWYLCFICILCCNCVRMTTTCITCQSASHRVSRAIVNSIIAAAAAALGSVLFVFLVKTILGKTRFHYLTSRLLANGVLLGLVSVAAGCGSYHHWVSFVIGVTSSIGYVIWCQVLYTVKVDDPVGSIAVHLGGGFWGLVCVHLFSEKMGLLFAEVSSTAALAILWNAIVGLVFAVGSAVVTATVLMIPKMFSLVPVSHVHEITGVDAVFLEQNAYPDGDKVTPFTTDVIEDRENFADSHLASPQTTDTSPMSYSLTRLRQENTLDLPFHYDKSNAYKKLDFNSKSMSSFARSPGVDRRVWFSGEGLRDQVAPMTPITDYQSREADRWDDIEF